MAREGSPIDDQVARTARIEKAAAVAIVLLALVLRLYHLNWSLPHSYEEAKPLRVAWQMWGWDEGIKVDLNPKFFNYPSLTFYVHFVAQGILYAAMKLFGSIKTLTDWRVMQALEPTPLFLVARSVGVLFGVGAVWVVYRLGRLVAGSGVALLAAALLAINPFHVARSQMVEVDVPLAFFVALALYSAVRVSLEGRRRDYVFAGLAAGLASSCKYTGALLVVPIALAHFLADRASKSAAGLRTARLRKLGLAVALMVVAFVVTSPYVLLDLDQFRKDLGVEREHMAFGHFGLEQGPAWVYYAKELGGGVISISTLLAALVGMGVAVVRRSRPAIVLASFAVLYLAVISTWTMKAERYLLPALPMIVIVAGVGLVAVWGRLQPWLPRARHGLVALTLSALVLVPDVVGYAHHVSGYQGDTRTDAAAWLLSNAPSGSYIVVEPYGPDLIRPSYIMTLDGEMRRAVVNRISHQPVFAVQTIPMFQVHPERSGRFYDLDLYPNADYVVVSSGVASRYRRDPDQFAPQNAFYDTLARQFEAVQVFEPARAEGLRLTVYRRRGTAPFGARAVVAPPSRLAPAGMNTTDARFYFELGTNYELFGKVAEAAMSYQLGIEQGTGDLTLFQQCALGEARCILAQKGGEEALAFVRSLAQQVEDATVRGALLRMADQMAQELRGRSPER